MKLGKNIITLLLLLFTFQHSYSREIDEKILKNEVSLLKDQNKFDSIIILLDKALDRKESTPYYRYTIYIEKFLVYKQLLNYAEANENLIKAEKEGKKSKINQKEIETRNLIEKIFVNFDLANYEKVNQLNSLVKSENLKYIDQKTKAFYIALLGVLESRNKNYDKAEKYYIDAIEILKQNNPKHLPNIYRKLVDLYYYKNDHNKAIKAFEDGLKIAEKYKMDLYILNMYEAITYYYSYIGDWEKAYKNRIIVNELAAKYDAINQSGKLQVIEKDLINKKNNLELRNQRNIKIFQAILSLILAILIFVLYKLYKINKEKLNLAESEINRMRTEISKLAALKNKDNQTLDLSKYDLTERQLEIIEFIKQGKTNKEIGNELYISENTVKYHLKIIYNILGIENRTYLK